MTRGLARGALVAAVLAAASGCSGPGEPRGRSVILVTLDTTRADRIGAYGGTAVPTPNLDRVAEEGVAFDLAFSQTPLTLPSHASMLTGRYPATHGVRHNGIYRLRESELTLTERLAEEGFETAAFVAAYVLNRGFGTEQGFATYVDVDVNRYQGGRDQVFEAQRTAEEVNRDVFRWLDDNDSRRVFLWVHYYDPHDPYEPPESPGRALAGEGYDREISYVDSCLGDLLARLREDGILDRSLLVIAGDHGESLGEHGERTHGVFLYESAVRVPFLLRAPGLLPEGARVAGPVELVDLAPTVLDLLGLDPLPAAQGESLTGRIEGTDDGVADVAYAETLMPRLEFGWSALTMIRTGRFKYIEAPRPELYDLRHDPGENDNLAPNDAERAGEMAGDLAAWIARTTDATAAQEAGRQLAPDEEARLRSLGYLGGDFFKQGGDDGNRKDPKDGIAEVRRLDEARDHLAEGAFQAALDGVRDILRDNPRNHQARSTRIRALVQLSRMDEAEEEALAALAAAETDPDASSVLLDKARVVLAEVLGLRGKREQAVQQYRRLLESDPENEAAAVSLAGILLEEGEHDEAGALVSGVLDRSPRNGLALTVRFGLELAAGEREKAVRTALLLSEARAGNRQTLVRAGDLLLESDEPEAAASCFEAAQEMESALDAALLGRIGTARLAAGQIPEAKQAFLTALRLRPRDPRPPYFLGRVHLREGDESSARRRFEQALRADPAFVAPLVALARWLASEGRLDEARETVREARRRNPRDREAAKAAGELGAAAAPSP